MNTSPNSLFYRRLSAFIGGPNMPQQLPIPLCVTTKERSTSYSMGEGLLQPMHLLIIAALAMLFFGPQKLPELGKGIGDGIRNFKSAMKGDPDPTSEPEKQLPSGEQK